ncbi:unnamed protein product [Ceutorhynchus assimilis]|uniref:Uncharacterized protein n=1 Tax=Ceutorhynchus assimilis TaxID=467358 RepID=A0A9N9MI08_9CUCU|nr:unnamed protein product [Ceutorhynchus assimilis]
MKFAYVLWEQRVICMQLVDGTNSHAIQNSWPLEMSTMNSNRNHRWNSVELYATYISNGGIRSRRTLISDLLDYFGNDLMVLSSSGIASIIRFRKEAAHLLNFENSEDDDFNMFKIASDLI